MQKMIEINCPQEILLGLHQDADQFAETVKLQAAIALFRDGKLTSGMAARWLKSAMRVRLELITFVPVFSVLLLDIKTEYQRLEVAP